MRSTMVRKYDLQPRISLKCLWSLNQYGSAPKTKKNTAKPKSIRPPSTLEAYQISPAASETRPRALRLYRNKVITDGG